MYRRCYAIRRDREICVVEINSENEMVNLTVSPRMRLAIVFATVAIIVAVGAWLWQATTDRQRQLVYEIPPGTATRLAAGEEVNIFPSTIVIDLRQYDTLVIQNNDSAVVTIGPFRIVPGQRFVQRYWGPGTYELICSVHQGEQLRIEVR